MTVPEHGDEKVMINFIYVFFIRQLIDGIHNYKMWTLGLCAMSVGQDLVLIGRPWHINHRRRPVMNTQEPAAGQFVL